MSQVASITRREIFSLEEIPVYSEMENLMTMGDLLAALEYLIMLQDKM